MHACGPACGERKFDHPKTMIVHYILRALNRVFPMDNSAEEIARGTETL